MKLTSIEIHSAIDVAPVTPPPPPVPTFDFTDSSGNGYDLDASNPGVFVTDSLIEGTNGAIGATPAGISALGFFPSNSLLESLNTGSFWMCGWVDDLTDFTTPIQIDGSVSGGSPILSIASSQVDSLTSRLTIGRRHTSGVEFKNVDVPITTGPNFIFGSYEIATVDKFKLYLDGILVSTQFGGGLTAFGTPDEIFVGYGPSAGTKIYDEIAVGIGIISDAEVAALYAARTNYASYTAAQLAMSPLAYYHLNSALV